MDVGATQTYPKLTSQPCAVAITRMPLLPSAVMNRPGTMGFSPMPAHGAHMEVRGA